MYEGKLNSATLQPIFQTGKVKFNLPKKAQQFRVVVWSKAFEEPDYITNWLDITYNKTYTLKIDYLIPAVPISGGGC